MSLHARLGTRSFGRIVMTLFVPLLLLGPAGAMAGTSAPRPLEDPRLAPLPIGWEVVDTLERDSAAVDPLSTEIHYFWLKNGDVVSGTLSASDARTLTLRTESGELRTVARTDLQRYSTNGRVRITMVDGNAVTGRLVSRTDAETVVDAGTLGTLRLKSVDVEATEELPRERSGGGGSRSDDRLGASIPQATRLIFVPNGYGLNAGEGYYQNIWVLANTFAYGITDNLSISGGLVPLFLFNGAPTPMWIGAKVSVPVTKDFWHVGAGGQVGTVLGEDATFGIVYGISTFGSRDNHVNVGTGFVFTGDDFETTPSFSLGFTKTLNRRWALVSENYYLPAVDDAVILSFGGRYMAGRASIDFALALPIVPDMDGFVAIPWLSVTVPF